MVNKKLIITALLIFVAVAVLGQRFTWRIEGAVANAMPTDTLIVVNAEKRSTITTLQIKDGNIIPVSGTLDEPAVCRIAKKGRQKWMGEFILESGTINLDIDLGIERIKHFGGTPMNDEYANLFTIQPQDTDMNSFHKRMYETITRVVALHPDYAISAYLVERFQTMFKPSEMIKLIEKLSPDLQATPKMERLKENLTLGLDTEEGNMFKELTGKNPKGEAIALSEFVGKGSYVLADFWASWCVPCLDEIPSVISLYDKYKDKGLKVIGVTVRDAPEKSESIVQKLGIPFPQIYESKPLSIYGVNAIPHTILFAPDGTILARGLRGDELGKKLKEIFGE